MVNVAVMQQLGISDHGLLPEPESFCYGAAFPVVHRGGYGYPVEPQGVEAMAKHGAAGSRHDPPTCECFGEPVSDRSGSVGPIDRMVADDAGDRVAGPYGVGRAKVVQQPVPVPIR